eukprot:gnl/Dysnectes_brevis/2443_a2910_982.p1 GENE.gnl/Dysnectes_brevis/2443_a2910_982~~gnl/Dysnectes_brevis/2443_a2910_982.p1  ORF type:complete len:1525 (-),score=561.64 gnl/Dysnectes_brevis/2443_a2910_982:66-4640(-)
MEEEEEEEDMEEGGAEEEAAIDAVIDAVVDVDVDVEGELDDDDEEDSTIAPKDPSTQEEQEEEEEEEEPVEESASVSAAPGHSSPSVRLAASCLHDLVTFLTFEDTTRPYELVRARLPCLPALRILERLTTMFSPAFVARPALAPELPALYAALRRLRDGVSRLVGGKGVETTLLAHPRFIAGQLATTLVIKTLANPPASFSRELLNEALHFIMEPLEFDSTTSWSRMVSLSALRFLATTPDAITPLATEDLPLVELLRRAAAHWFRSLPPSGGGSGAFDEQLATGLKLLGNRRAHLDRKLKLVAPESLPTASASAAAGASATATSPSSNPPPPSASASQAGSPTINVATVTDQWLPGFSISNFKDNSFLGRILVPKTKKQAEEELNAKTSVLFLETVRAIATNISALRTRIPTDQLNRICYILVNSFELVSNLTQNLVVNAACLHSLQTMCQQMPSSSQEPWDAMLRAARGALASASHDSAMKAFADAVLDDSTYSGSSTSSLGAVGVGVADEPASPTSGETTPTDVVRHHCVPAWELPSRDVSLPKICQLTSCLLRLAATEGNQVRNWEQIHNSLLLLEATIVSNATDFGALVSYSDYRAVVETIFNGLTPTMETSELPRCINNAALAFRPPLILKLLSSHYGVDSSLHMCGDTDTTACLRGMISTATRLMNTPITALVAIARIRALLASNGSKEVIGVWMRCWDLVRPLLDSLSDAKLPDDTRRELSLLCGEFAFAGLEFVEVENDSLLAPLTAMLQIRQFAGIAATRISEILVQNGQLGSAWSPIVKALCGVTEIDTRRKERQYPTDEILVLISSIFDSKGLALIPHHFLPELINACRHLNSLAEPGAVSKIIAGLGEALSPATDDTDCNAVLHCLNALREIASTAKQASRQKTLLDLCSVFESLTMPFPPLMRAAIFRDTILISGSAILHQCRRNRKPERWFTSMKLFLTRACPLLETVSQTEWSEGVPVAILFSSMNALLQDAIAHTQIAKEVTLAMMSLFTSPGYAERVLSMQSTTAVDELKAAMISPLIDPIPIHEEHLHLRPASLHQHFNDPALVPVGSHSFGWFSRLLRSVPRHILLVDPVYSEVLTALARPGLPFLDQRLRILDEVLRRAEGRSLQALQALHREMKNASQEEFLAAAGRLLNWAVTADDQPELISVALCVLVREHERRLDAGESLSLPLVELLSGAVFDLRASKLSDHHVVDEAIAVTASSIVTAFSRLPKQRAELWPLILSLAARLLPLRASSALAAGQLRILLLLSWALLGCQAPPPCEVSGKLIELILQSVWNFVPHPRSRVSFTYRVSGLNGSEGYAQSVQYRHIALPSMEAESIREALHYECNALEAVRIGAQPSTVCGAVREDLSDLQECIFDCGLDLLLTLVQKPEHMPTVSHAASHAALQLVSDVVEGFLLELQLAGQCPMAHGRMRNLRRVLDASLVTQYPACLAQACLPATHLARPKYATLDAACLCRFHLFALQPAVLRLSGQPGLGEFTRRFWSYVARELSGVEEDAEEES